MTGIGHLSTGLLLKGKFPRTPLPLLLFAAVAPDLLWAFLNLAPMSGRPPLEVARVAQPYDYIGSQMLISQPWSHSLLGTALLAALLAALTFLAFRRASVAAAVLLATLGHWGLDYLVHDADLTLGWAWDAARVGPPFVLDPAQPARGLFATSPLVGFALQTAVVLWGSVAFARAFPSPQRRGRLWLVGGVGALVLLSLPVFIKGALGGRITSSDGLIIGALAEIAVGAFVLVRVCARTAGPALQATPFAAPDGPEAVRFVRNLLDTAAAICFLLAALYLGQGMRDAQRLPSVGACSTILAVCYLVVGRRFVAKNASMLWVAVLLTLVIGPVARAAFAPGSFALGLFALEAGLGILSASLVRTLLRRDLLL